MREAVFVLLSAERLRRKADELIREAECVSSRDARERLRDAAARTLEAAGYLQKEVGYV